MKVFKNKYGGWETLCSNHLLNGEVIKYYLTVSFQRGQEPLVDSIDIEPTRWWHTCYLTKNNAVKPKLFIADWKTIEKDDSKKNEWLIEDEKPTENEVVFDHEDLPFY